jgi:CBS domain-containing membrane protein
MDLKLPVSTIMITPVECVGPQDEIRVVKHLYERQNFHRHFPVVEKNNLVGMVSLADYMHAIGDATLDDNEPVYSLKKVEDIMSHNPVTVSKDTSIAEVGKLLAKGAFSSIIVLDNDRVSGIVTTTDLIRYFLKQVDGSLEF